MTKRHSFPSPIRQLSSHPLFLPLMGAVIRPKAEDAQSVRRAGGERDPVHTHGCDTLCTRMPTCTRTRMATCTRTRMRRAYARKHRRPRCQSRFFEKHADQEQANVVHALSQVAFADARTAIATVGTRGKACVCVCVCVCVCIRQHNPMRRDSAALASGCPQARHLAEA